MFYFGRENELSNEDRMRVTACLVEGNSLRAAVRTTGIHQTMILKWLVDLGDACADYQNKTLVNLPCKRSESWETDIADVLSSQPEQAVPLLSCFAPVSFG